MDEGEEKKKRERERFVTRGCNTSRNSSRERKKTKTIL